MLHSPLTHQEPYIKPVGKLMSAQQAYDAHIIEQSTSNLHTSLSHYITTTTNGSVVVRSRTTNKFFVLSPKALLQLAFEAGIDMDESA